MRIASLGHAIFAATVIVLGIMALIEGNSSAVWQPVPRGVFAFEVWLYLGGFVSLAAGTGLLWRRHASAAARVLFVYFLLRLLVFRVPALLHSLAVDVYWAVSKDAVMVAAAWVLYIRFADDWDRRRLGFVVSGKGLRIARVLYGLALIPFGIAHFQFVEHTASLVPAWLPAHAAWAYFTGSCFIAAGLAIAMNVSARLAAALSALQMGLFLLLVWVPRVAAGSVNTFQWGETVVTWVLTAAAWVVADSYGRDAWFPAHRLQTPTADQLVKQ